ncbi:unnamed protein product [[Actinomadura] parvosata subsp. kistnae]|uniref:Uncharacterized protein n=1 Tax=[Actinomadura] parvosata subsp. kistnae TaxID=1909395 RepID=A0A1V0A5K3_9ACTN|nr:hypothetical protein [Nonomuraea sp. ATCC 55076]AQZ65490.1 hypothetical protein BKM31_32130 [Nonomuraea sp. ATCC 55076]SPL96839.1 unnamed protein product [Actinomadura parvosata subsp. kistnae]
MAVRPTTHWRENVAEEARLVASGELDPADAYAAELFPESMLLGTDEVLSRFEADLAALSAPSDEEVFAAVERAVLALNQVNEQHGEAAYETGEREHLCAFIEESIVEAGIDVDALAARHGLTRHEITDKWREW